MCTDLAILADIDFETEASNFCFHIVPWLSCIYKKLQDFDSIPGPRISLAVGNDNLLQYSYLENFMESRAQ